MYSIMDIIFTVNSNDSNHFSSVFSQVDCCYPIYNSRSSDKTVHPISAT